MSDDTHPHEEMSVKYIPPELVYESPKIPDNCVALRYNIMLQSPTSVFSGDSGSNQISFTLQTSNFVDLSTVELYASITSVITPTTSATTVYGYASTATCLLVNDTLSIFDSLVVTSGGRVLEEIRNAVQLGALLKNISCSDQYLSSEGTSWNSSSNPINGQRDQYQNGTAFKINALKLLGILSCKKYVSPASMGSLTFTFTLAKSNEIATVRNGADTCPITLTNVQLYYDELIVTSEYQRHFNEQYQTQGWHLNFDSWGTQSVAVSSLNNVQIPFSASCTRCKGVIAAIQDSSKQGYLYPSTAFVSAGQTSWQFVLGGNRYPISPVMSTARQLCEIQRFTFSIDDVQRATYSTKQLSTDVVLTGAYGIVSGTVDSTNVLQNSKGAMVMNLERYESNQETGIPLNPATSSLMLTNSSGLTTAQVYFFWNYSRAVGIYNGNLAVKT